MDSLSVMILLACSLKTHTFMDLEKFCEHKHTVRIQLQLKEYWKLTQDHRIMYQNISATLRQFVY